MLGYRAAQGALGVISPRITMPLARGVFRAAYYAWPQKRRIILDNASHVLHKPVRTRPWGAWRAGCMPHMPNS